MRLVIALAASGLIASCQQPVAAPQAKVDLAAEAAALDALEAGQIGGITQKNAAAASGVYADDAAFIADNGARTIGKAGIDEMFAALVKDPNLKLDYLPGKKIVSADGTMAYATATFTQSYTDAATGKAITTKGTNLSVWRKQPDGKWKLVAESNPAAIVN